MLTKNPSRWSQRFLIVIVAFIGMSLAFYMGLFQLGLITSVWDPLFGKESELVLTSQIAKWIKQHFFISDAILGGLAYLSDGICACCFSDQRWRRQPWIVILFGINIYPVGLVSFYLVALQIFIVKKGCLLCLLSASVSGVLMILAYEEIAASVRYLIDVWKTSKSYRALWLAFLGRNIHS